MKLRKLWLILMIMITHKFQRSLLNHEPLIRVYFFIVSQEMTALSLFMMGSNKKELSPYFEDALAVYRSNTKLGEIMCAGIINIKHLSLGIRHLYYVVCCYIVRCSSLGCCTERQPMPSSR